VGGDQARVSRAWPSTLRNTAVGVNFADTVMSPPFPMSLSAAREAGAGAGLLSGLRREGISCP
jgi:hypothetical protein